MRVGVGRDRARNGEESATLWSAREATVRRTSMRCTSQESAECEMRTSRRGRGAWRRGRSFRGLWDERDEPDEGDLRAFEVPLVAQAPAAQRLVVLQQHDGQVVGITGLAFDDDVPFEHAPGGARRG